MSKYNTTMISRKINLLALCAFSTLLFSAPLAFSAISASADSFVQRGNGNTNFGTSGSITIKGGDSASTTRKGYIRFDLSTITEPITDATITFTVSTNNGGGGNTNLQNFTVNVFGLKESLDTWSQGSITWNNAPANNTFNNNFIAADVTSLGSFTVNQTPIGDTVTFSSAGLISFLNADTDDKASILLQRSAGGSSNLAFASSENLTYDAPLLTAVPEPGHYAALFGLLGIAFAYIQRRR